MSLPVVFFDFGNVLGFFDYNRIYARLGARLSLSAEAFRELAEVRGLRSKLAEFEAGATTPLEFSTCVQDAVGLDIPFEEFAADWQDIFELNAPVAAIAADLKSMGHILGVASNTNAIHAEYYRRRFQKELAVFDHFILSYEVKAMKPGLSFFSACTAVVGAAAGSCVFIDDVEENVQGACDAGLVGIVYRDPAGLVADLRRHGLEVSAVDVRD